jgi:hypothetical protein
MIKKGASNARDLHLVIQRTVQDQNVTLTDSSAVRGIPSSH